MFDYIRFGKGIKYFRTKQGMSIDAFLDLVDINRTYLIRIEQGKAKPAIKMALKLCNALNVSIDDCLNAEPELQ